METLRYANLSTAIIEQAVKDYETQLHEHYKKGDNITLEHIKSLEKFFKSEWFNALATLCNLNISGITIIKTVKDRIKTECINQVSL